MSQTPLNNSAARVHAVLQKALEVGGEGTTVFQVFSPLYGTAEGDMASYMRAHAQVIEAAWLARDAIRDTPGIDSSIYTPHVEIVARGLSEMYLLASWRDVRAKFDAVSVHTLRIVADLLARDTTEKALDTTDLDALREQAETFMQLRR